MRQTESEGVTAVEVGALDHKTLLDVLNAAYRSKRDERLARETYDALVGTVAKPGVLRRWAREHKEEVLYDGETGVELVRQMRSAGERLDVMGLVEHSPEAVLKLAQLGLLVLDVPAWKAHAKDFIQAMPVRAWLMPGGEVEVIKVVKRDG